MIACSPFARSMSCSHFRAWTRCMHLTCFKSWVESASLRQCAIQKWVSVTSALLSRRTFVRGTTSVCGSIYVGKGRHATSNRMFYFSKKYENLMSFACFLSKTSKILSHNSYFFDKMGNANCSDRKETKPTRRNFTSCGCEIDCWTCNPILLKSKVIPCPSNIEHQRRWRHLYCCSWISCCLQCACFRKYSEKVDSQPIVLTSRVRSWNMFCVAYLAKNVAGWHTRGEKLTDFGKTKSYTSAQNSCPNLWGFFQKIRKLDRVYLQIQSAWFFFKNLQIGIDHISLIRMCTATRIVLYLRVSHRYPRQWRLFGTSC